MEAGGPKSLHVEHFNIPTPALQIRYFSRFADIERSLFLAPETKSDHILRMYMYYMYVCMDVCRDAYTHLHVRARNKMNK